MFKRQLAPIVAALATVFSIGTASATTVSLDLAGAGVFSCDSPGQPCNITLTIDLGAALGTPGVDVQLNGLGWDLTIETVGFSWLNEAVIAFQYDDGTGSVVERFTLTAGAGDNSPGSSFYSSGGLVDLAAAGITNTTVVGGSLFIEFYESFDDVGGAIDAFYRDPSSLTLDIGPRAVPEPATLPLVAVTLFGLIAAGRRRRPTAVLPD